MNNYTVLGKYFEQAKPCRKTFNFYKKKMLHSPPPFQISNSFALEKMEISSKLGGQGVLLSEFSQFLFWVTTFLEAAKQ